MGDESNPMKPASPEQAVFAEALQRDTPDARAAYLDGACGTDTPLRRRVESLLHAAESAGDFLEQPPTGLAAGDGSTMVVTFPSEKPGDRIGRYKLLQQIGEGGCGIVYMAEQEEPVRRRVALKVIKLGMDTKSVIARFEAERQALALMDHPNIAKVLDAGATDTGRPYFVMELVRGIKITDYCDENTVPTEARLQLFVQVCQAIQHAHQKGIIHRDIKPSNILVADHDGVPVPKVIDFGIAKATTDQRLTDKTLFTAFEQFIGTPAYMSPEQANLSGLDIDTRTDIYALGVLLYELLTGQTPFDAKDLMAAGLDAMRRIILEQEPARPSTRLSTMLAADLTAVASHRHAEPGRLGTLLRGDLDWIVMKALEKDRTRRYETANGLALDIQRHLANEPVVARPPSAAYRVQKMIRRNKLACAAGGAVAIALVLGVVASTWQAVRARRAENVQRELRQQAEASQKRSETEAAKADAVSDFLQQMLRSANPDALKGTQYSVRQMLDDFSAGLTNQLADQPEVEAAVRATIGRAYHRLGVATDARAHLERALALQRSIFGAESEQVAETLKECAWSCFEQSQFQQAEIYAREALDICRQRRVSDLRIISTLLVLHRILKVEGRWAEATTITDEALSIAGKSPNIEFPDVASMLHGQAEMRNDQSRFTEAEALAQRAVAMHRRLRGQGHPETAWALFSLGVAQRGQQKLAESEAALREALTIFSKYYSAGHKSVDWVRRELKSVLETRGDFAGLQALARQQLKEADKRIEQNNADPEAWMQRGSAHKDLNMGEVAMEDYAKARANSPNDVELRLRIAEQLRGQGKLDEVEPLYREALALQRKLPGGENQQVAITLGSLSFVLREKGELPEAETTAREALGIRKKLLGDEHADVAQSLHLLAWNLNLQGKHAEAESLSREEVAMWRKLLGNEHPNVAWALGDLTIFLRDQKKLPEAETAIRESLAIRRKAFGNEHPDAVSSSNLLSDLLREQGKLAESAVPRP
jgi:tetratricopeptide (TPR) repeat protein/tRNA A-37 threonylcarbamoyl transferase component Bud32